MKRLVAVQLLAMCLINTFVETKKTEDYCWRDYKGEIPSDALLVNERFKTSRPVYIGQAISEGKLVPGKIYKGDPKIYYEYYNVEFSRDSAVKILCSSKPEKFEWIPVQYVEVNRMNREFVKGGYEANCTTYLGRVETLGEILPGKVMCCKASHHCYGLYTTSNKKGTLHFNFEILAYNANASKPPNKPESEEMPPEKCRRVVINLFN